MSRRVSVPISMRENSSSERENLPYERENSPSERENSSSEREKRPLEELSKLIRRFPAEHVVEIEVKHFAFPWSFKNLEEAIEDEKGVLFGKQVFLFGCCEFRLAWLGDELDYYYIPTIIAVDSSIPPFDKVVFPNSDEKIVSLEEVELAWYRYNPPGQMDAEKFNISYLGSSTLENRASDKKELYLPYYENPFMKESEVLRSTFVPIHHENPVEFELEHEFMRVIILYPEYLDLYFLDCSKHLEKRGHLYVTDSSSFREFVRDKRREHKAEWEKMEKN